MLTAKMQRRFDPDALRRTVIEMAYAGSTGHIAPAFSIIEVLAVLYRSHLNLGDGSPDSPGRDYLVLSKGHGIMAQYACMHEIGWLSAEELGHYFGDGTVLKGLSDAHVPGVETTSGSMGHGLSVGVGLAWAAKRLGTKQRCFAIVGDGEMNEGPIWEAFLFAAHWELSNLTVIIDNNGLQAMGRVEEVLRLGSIASDRHVSYNDSQRFGGVEGAEGFAERCCPNARSQSWRWSQAAGGCRSGVAGCLGGVG